MSGTMKVLVMIVLWFLYTIIAYKGCLEQCCSAPIVEDTIIQKEVKRYPLDFKWDDMTAFQNEGFSEMKSNHLASMTDDNIFEITGIYYDGEATPAGYANMGLARAAKIKALYLSDIPEDRIRLLSRKVDGNEAIDGFFESASFGWAEKTDTAPVLEEIDEVAKIRFPFNSTKKDVDAEVDDYLARLAKRIIQSGESVSLTGHTDSKGKDKYNMRLSRKRAEKIRDILKSKGVKSNQIKIDFKGSSDPEVANDTEINRHRNRRVVVRLLKK